MDITTSDIRSFQSLLDTGNLDVLDAARDLYGKRDWEATAELLRDPVEKHPFNIEAVSLLSAALFKMGTFDEALPLLARVLAMNPNDLKSIRRLRAIASKIDPVAEKPRAGAARRVEIDEVLELARKFGLEPNTIFDIGVCMGTPGLYDTVPNAQLILVDPVEESEPFMRQICDTVNHGDFIVAAAGAREGVAGLSFPGYPSGSRMTDSVGHHKGGTVREVPVVTLDNLAEKFGSKGPYIVKLDTEGSELEVLRGAPKVLEDTDLIVMETRLRPIGKAPQIFEVLKFLKENGFVLYDIITFNYHDIDETLKQVDVVAVKENGFFRSSTKYRPPPRQATKAAKGLMENIVESKRAKFDMALQKLRV